MFRKKNKSDVSPKIAPVASNFETLPLEVMGEILFHLDVKSILSFAQTKKANLEILLSLLERYPRKDKSALPFELIKLYIKLKSGLQSTEKNNLVRDYLIERRSKHESIDSFTNEESEAFGVLCADTATIDDNINYVLRTKNLTKVSVKSLLDIILTLRSEYNNPSSKYYENKFASFGSIYRFLIMFYFLHHYNLFTLQGESLVGYLEQFKQENKPETIQSVSAQNNFERKVDKKLNVLYSYDTNALATYIDLISRKIPHKYHSERSQVNLSGLTIHDARLLENYNINDYNLSNVKILGSTLCIKAGFCDFSGVDFSHKDLKGSSFSHCKMRDVSFHQAIMADKISYSELINVDFSQAYFEEKFKRPEVIKAWSKLSDNTYSDCKFDKTIIKANFSEWRDAKKIFFDDPAFMDANKFKKSYKYFTHTVDHCFVDQNLLEFFTKKIAASTADNAEKNKIIKEIKSFKLFKDYFGLFSKPANLGTRNEVRIKFLALEANLKR